MKLLRRILVTASLTLVLLFTVVRWAADVALTFWEGREAPPVARIVPTNLPDQAISQASGRKLSCLGYEFEVPWTDLDDSKTELYPKNKPDKTMALFTFRSGLRLRVAVFSTGEFRTLFTTDWKLSPQQFEQFAGRDAEKSDYLFLRKLYEFTPDKVNFWAWFIIHSRPRCNDAFAQVRRTRQRSRDGNIRYSERKLQRISTRWSIFTAGRAACHPLFEYGRRGNRALAERLQESIWSHPARN